jgi:hypothetical protein
LGFAAIIDVKGEWFKAARCILVDPFLVTIMIYL